MIQSPTSDIVENYVGTTSRILPKPWYEPGPAVAELGGEPRAMRWQAPGGLAPWQLRRVRDFIEARLGSDSSTAVLADLCRLSASHFARAFRQSCGMPPHRWLVKRRIDHAKTLLLEGKQSLAAIADICGFVDQSHLTRAFGRHEKCSPGKWRRLHRA